MTIFGVRTLTQTEEEEQQRVLTLSQTEEEERVLPQDFHQEKNGSCRCLHYGQTRLVQLILINSLRDNSQMTSRNKGGGDPQYCDAKYKAVAQADHKG